MSLATERQSRPRHVLRESTTDAHVALERLVEAGGHFQDAAHYKGWLRRMHAAHMRYAVDYDQGARLAGLEPLSQPLSVALQADLAETLPTATRSSAVRVGSGPGYALGVAYVFEGSAMGARIVLKALKDTSGVATGYLSYLVSHSRDRWPALIRTLDDRLGEDDAEMRSAVAGARAVFSHLQTLFAADAHGDL